MTDDTQRAEQTQELLQAESKFRALIPHMEPKELLSGYGDMLNLVVTERIRAKLIPTKDEPSVAQQHRLTIYALEQEMLRRMKSH